MQPQSALMFWITQWEWGEGKERTGKDGKEGVEEEGSGEDQIGLEMLYHIWDWLSIEVSQASR